MNKWPCLVLITLTLGVCVALPSAVLMEQYIAYKTKTYHQCVKDNK